jgi:hypothetical protein
MDREKVIKEYEDFVKSFSKRDDTYYKSLFNSVLALLKEQEAVEPEIEVLNEIDRLYRCSRCHKHFFYEKQKYCDECGQAVKWE